MDAVKEDIEMVDVEVDEAGRRVGWSQMIHCGDTYRVQSEEEFNLSSRFDQ